MTDICYSESSMESFARRLRYLADDSGVLEGYIRDNTNFRAAGANALFEIFAMHADAVSSTYANAAGSLNHVLGYLADSAATTIETYQNTDQSRAQAFAGVAASPVTATAVCVPDGISPDLDHYEPSIALEPPEPVPVRDFGDLVNQLSGWLSVSGMISELIYQIWGANLFEEASKKFVGNWEKVYSSADAFRNVAAYHDKLATCVQTARNSVEWTGQAADSAYDTCTQLTGKLREQVDPLQQVAAAYAEAAHAIEGGAQIVGDTLGGIVDDLLVAAAAAVAGAFLAATGVGLAVGESMAVAAVGDALALAARVSSKLSELAFKMDSLGSLVELVDGVAKLRDAAPEGNGTEIYG